MAERYGQFSKLNSNMDAETDAERKKKRDAVAPQPVEQLPKDPDALLNRMNELASSQQFQEEAPVSARKSLAEAMDKANKAYQERASKNEWAEVAQLVGRSLAQLGAAQEGMRTGRDMSKLDFGPGIDYGARTSRAAQDYQQELRNISSLEDLSSQERKELQDAARNKYSRESGVLGKALETQLALGREERLARGTESAEQARARREDALERNRMAREKAIQDKDDSRLSLQERRMQLSELDKQESSLASKLKARETLKNLLQQEGDLSGKTVSKLQEKYGTIAATADIDLAALKAELEGATKPGKLWGTNPDEEKQAGILQSKSDELREALDSIRANKKALLNTPNTPSTSGASNIVPEKAPSSRVQVRFQGRILEIDRAQLPQAIKDGAVEI